MQTRELLTRLVALEEKCDDALKLSAQDPNRGVVLLGRGGDSVHELGLLPPGASLLTGKLWKMGKKAVQWAGLNPFTTAAAGGAVNAAGTAMANRNEAPENRKSIVGAFLKGTVGGYAAGVAGDSALRGGASILKGRGVADSAARAVRRVGIAYRHPGGADKLLRKPVMQAGMLVAGMGLGKKAYDGTVGRLPQLTDEELKQSRGY